MLSLHGVDCVLQDYLASCRVTNIKYSNRKKETSHSLLDSFMCSDHQGVSYSHGQHPHRLPAL